MKSNRVLQILIGNRETMKKGFACGTVTTLIISILYIFLIGSPSGLLIIILATLLGHAFGWLFIRPIAQLIEFKQPHLSEEAIWRKSSAIAWLPLAILIFFPQADDMLFFEKLIIIAMVFLGVSVASFTGGYRVMRVKLNVYYKEGKAYGLIGGKVTGLLLAITWLCSGYSAIQMQTGDSLQATIANALVTILIFSVLASIPAHLAFGIGYLLGKRHDFDKRWQLPYVISGAVVWGSLASLLFIHPSNSTEKYFLNVLLVLAVSTCGGLGGWAMGQFYATQNWEKTPTSIQE